MATQPAEQILVDQIAAWLGLIQRANGYHTDAGTRVSTEEPDETNDPVMPSILVLDEIATSGSRTWTQQLTIEGAVDADPKDARATCRRLQADIVAALRAGLKLNQHNTDVIRALRVTGKETPRREPGGTTLAPTISVEVEYHDPAAS